jgi:hypothetical protein
MVPEAAKKIFVDGFTQTDASIVAAATETRRCMAACDWVKVPPSFILRSFSKP